jgi:hypothetical protein
MFAASATVGCDAMGNGGFGSVGAMACPELSAGDVLTASVSADARANGKIKTFMLAARDLAQVSAQVEAEAAEACLRMGADLGMAPAELAPRNEPGGRASGACNAVAARIDAVLRQGLSVEVRATPPVCQASADAEARCQGACDVDVDPGQIVAHCDPARLSGYCQGTCGGACNGNCSGQCSGQCSAYDAQGRCAGRCNGTCGGYCDAECHASCQGKWQAPKCEGSARPPSADAECNASCRAHADVSASCSPAQVTVRTSQNAPMAARLAATLQANLPELLHAEWTLGRRLASDAEVVGQVGAQLPKIAANAGAHALACVAASADAAARASVSIRVSVQASANVSGRVGAAG